MVLYTLKLTNWPKSLPRISHLSCFIQTSSLQASEVSLLKDGNAVQIRLVNIKMSAIYPGKAIIYCLYIFACILIIYRIFTCIMPPFLTKKSAM